MLQEFAFQSPTFDFRSPALELYPKNFSFKFLIPNELETAFAVERPRLATDSPGQS